MIDLFDGHCDTILKCYLEGMSMCRSPGHLDLERTRKFGRYAQFFAAFGSPEDMPGRALWEVFLEEAALLQRELEANSDRVALCRTGAEAEAAFQAGKAAAFFSAEGAELLDCDLEKLRIAHKMGVRAVNLTWNHPNALSGTNAKEQDLGAGKGLCPGDGRPGDAGGRIPPLRSGILGCDRGLHTPHYRHTFQFQVRIFRH